VITRERLQAPVLLLGGLAAVFVAGLATFSPLYLVALIGAGAYVIVLFLDGAAGLAIFTLLTFFGELGHGASPIKAAGALIVVAWLVQILRPDRPARFIAWSRPNVFYLGVGLVLWSGASVLWAANAGAAESTAVRLALNMTLFVVVPSLVTTRRDLLLVLNAYVFGAALTALYGVASGNAQSDATGRLAGGIGDPNELAALLVPGIVLAIVLFAIGSKRPLIRFALVLAIVIDLFALVAAQSRGGFVALFGAALAGVVYSGRHRMKVLSGIVLFSTIALTVVVVGGINLGRLSSFGGGTGRTDIWAVAIRVFRSHPFAGVGIGNFTVVEPRYAAGNLNLPRVDLVLDQQKVAHNTYLNVLADLGVVGLGLFALLIVLVLRGLVRRIRVGDDWIPGVGRGLLIALAGLLIAYVFISAQYEKQLWLLLGVALAAAELASPQPSVSARRRF
jgi:O-antigen ligase